MRVFMVAVLLLAGMLQASKPGLEIKKEESVPVFSTSGTNRGTPAKPSDFSAKEPTDTLYYYNYVDYTAIGLSQGGTFEAAIRLTPEELGPYNNWSLIMVRFFHHENVSHSGQVKIYAQGTQTEPGALITTQPFTAPTSGWITITLDNPVTINSGQDLWVSVEITHAAEQYPISVDSGPAVPFKGDFVYEASLGWAELGTYNLNYNWDIEAIVQLTGDPQDPLSPSNLTAYSDYTTPTSIHLTWTDPTTRVDGTPLDSFRIRILRFSELQPDPVFVDTLREGIGQYTDTGLTDGVRYTYILQTWTYDDSLSVPVSVSWYAGGDPWPAPPALLQVNVITEDTVEIVGRTPATQRDGTPLDDLAGINVYINGNLHHFYAITNPNVVFYDTVEVIPGTITVFLKAIDNEISAHESEPSNPITVITNVHAGGPDGYGYTFKDSDYGTGPSFIWYDTQGGQVITLGDDAVATLNLPFAFPFYEQNLTSIYLCSNGFLSDTTLTSLSNYDLPYVSFRHLIAFFWDDLNPTAGGQIRYLATPDYAVIHFENVPHYGTYQPGVYNMQCILYPNGDIVMSYLHMEGTLNSSTIGIQGNRGENNWYLKYTYNGNPLVVHDSLTIYWKRPVRAHDLAVNSILEPGDLIPLQPFTPTASIRNVGAEIETNIDVEFMIKLGDDIIYSHTINVSQIGPEQSITLTFNEFTPPVASANFYATVTILFSDDNNQNNTLTKNFFVYEELTDFEDNNGGFEAQAGTQWEWGIPTSGPGSAHSGQKCWATVIGGSYPNSANWSLYSPEYQAAVDTPSIAFFHWYQFENNYDGGNIAVSVNNGPYVLVTPRGGYTHTSIAGLGEPGYSGSSGGWNIVVVDLPQIVAGDYFRVKLRFGSDASVTYPGWYVDDFLPFGANPTSVGEGSLITKLYIPSIFKNSISFALNIDKPQKLEVILYDVSGREVQKLFSGTVNHGQHKITSNTTLSKGVYFLKLQLGGESITRKVIVTK